MSRTCNTHAKDDKCVKSLGAKLERNRPFEMSKHSWRITLI
jgi:hypothetical protein